MMWIRVLQFALLSKDEKLAAWRRYVTDVELEAAARSRFHDLLHRCWRTGDVPVIIVEEDFLRWIEARRLQSDELAAIAAWEERCIRACDPGCPEFWDRLEPEDRYCKPEDPPD